ncbi:hypothetical protein SDC9_85086 [bioreactor metagenome]|uniref:Bacteriophage T5 Orf172 DNA-binding domain-containing protein n=1 Tax=bioreactor metagenome TaxID=1076179 RepID=A0A644ZCP7_9ZZZZ
MGIFDIFKVNQYKQEINSLNQEIERLNKQISSLQFTKDELEYIDLKEKLKSMQNNLVSLELEKVKFNEDIEYLINKISRLENEINSLDNILDIQSYGFYEPKYNFESSSIYKTRLDAIRLRQKDMVKSRMATVHNLDWTIGNDRKKGKEFILDTIKLILRAFNNECDNIIIKVKFNNIEASEKKIKKVFDDLNKLTDMQNVSIKDNYLKLKLEELYLKYEYECKLHEEKEEQQAIKERMREEAKALKELEAARKKIEKEETHFNNAIQDLNTKLLTASDKEKDKLLKKLQELEEKLAAVEQSKQNISDREKNTRAGYVYVISNIGSFGENIYKIGMTRRLEPMDRVKELGDASVPFSFDVHAMIFSDDAPSLENALHKKFQKYSLNKVNLRKEFFNISLEEIEMEVNANHNSVVEFTKLAEANEFRQSLILNSDKLISATC